MRDPCRPGRCISAQRAGGERNPALAFPEALQNGLRAGAPARDRKCVPKLAAHRRIFLLRNSMELDETRLGLSPIEIRNAQTGHRHRESRLQRESLLILLNRVVIAANSRPRRRPNRGRPDRAPERLVFRRALRPAAPSLGTYPLPDRLNLALIHRWRFEPGDKFGPGN